jgi:hypothetical protein
MASIWSYLIATSQIPELETQPYAASYHLIAEFLTASALLFGGYSLLSGKRWGFNTFLISMGMLLYTVINTIGYYAQSGDVTMMAVFTLFAGLTALFLALSFLLVNSKPVLVEMPRFDQSPVKR